MDHPAAIGLDRRVLLASPLAFLPMAAGEAASRPLTGSEFALVSRVTPKAGRESEYLRVILEPVGDVRGCLLFSVGEEADSPNVFWTIEVWQDEASYKAALNLPLFKRIIAAAMPLVETTSGSR